MSTQVKPGASQFGDDWTEVAALYKQLTTRVAEKPIAALLSHANAARPFSTATGIHDNGAGPGPVLSKLLSEYAFVIPASARISASDKSAAMVAQLKVTRKEGMEKGGVEGEVWGRVQVAEMDAMDLSPIKDASLSHVTAGWVYFMTPDPMECLKESRRVLEVGGVLALSSWKGNDWWEAMDCVVKVKPDAPKLVVPDEWRDVELLKVEMEKAGFREVQTWEVGTEMEFTSYRAMGEMILRLPNIKMLNLTEEQKVEYLGLVTEVLKRKCATEPGTLHGMTLVGVGKK